ncbi:MAG: phosphotransferase [Dermatophilaceae bacterium]
MPTLPPDYRRTSERPAWAELPPAVREGVGACAGGVVVGAEAPVGSGFTGSFAGLVHLADGRSVFAKAAGPAMPHAVGALRREAEVLAVVDPLTCVPRLVGWADVATDDGTWVVLVLEPIDGRHPGMPWTDTDVRAVHDACVEIVGLTPERIDRLGLVSLVADMADAWGIDGVYAGLASGERPWPTGLAPVPPERLREAEVLVTRAGTALVGTALSHNDIRPDNLLLTADGRAIVLDWNWVRAAPAWFDFVCMWPQMAADGVDLAAYDDSPLLAGADSGDIEVAVAVLGAYMLADWDASHPPGCTAALRVHQLWQGELCLDFLAARRGW